MALVCKRCQTQNLPRINYRAGNFIDRLYPHKFSMVCDRYGIKKEAFVDGGGDNYCPPTVADKRFVCVWVGGGAVRYTWGSSRTRCVSSVSWL